MQVANIFLCRSEHASVFSFRLLSNHWIASGIFVELTLLALIVYTPLGNWLFATAPASGGVWFLALQLALAMTCLEEVRKWWARRRNSRVSVTDRSARGLIRTPSSLPPEHAQAG